MQRMLILALAAALAALGGCAARDPNLTVRPLGEFSRAAGDYTLNVNLYSLDEKGRPRLDARDDASLRGFVSRTLAPKGYALKNGGQARYGLEVHLLCGNMRQADLGLMNESLALPAGTAGSTQSEQVHYWLPEASTSSSARDLRDSNQGVRGGVSTDRPGQNTMGGAHLGRMAPDFCQGRVLVVLSPAAPGAAREVFVSRAATEDCRAVSGCPADVCRSALEQSLVDLLERRF